MVVGQSLGPYRVLAKLGEGGMGEVYKARDARLDRDVAIKVVASHSIDSQHARERFQREARAVAALQHPNICTVYDVGDAAGHGFIVMELLHGETLQQRLQRGPLDFAQVIDVGIALADALHVAHTAGIVHRDLKPANIFLTERGPKLLDFGLAKADARRDDSKASAIETRALLTESGSMIGTVAYMSPEQLQGEVVDARSDLFSLGLVLYELAVGRRAFDGTTSAAIGAAILHQQPQPLSSVRPALPQWFDQIVLKALEKNRDLRYQSAGDLRVDLQRQRRTADANAFSTASIETNPGRATRWPRMAVAAAALIASAVAGYSFFFTPARPMLNETDTIMLSDFSNTTGDPVFDDALRQGLIVQLQQSPFLHILSDQRVRRVLTMMGQPPEARLTPAVALEVCQRSGSAALVEGSIASLGTQYVLGLRATDCRTGELIDSQQSQVLGKENVLGALSGIASAFRSRAGESLATIRTHERPLQEATTSSLEALKLYSQSAAVGCELKIPLLLRVIELDPTFAVPYANLGPCYAGLGQRQLAIQSATRAYELRERTTDPERFFIEYAYDRDVTGDLEKAFQTVTLWAQTYPRDLIALTLRGGYAANGTGRFEDVIESSERALAIDGESVFGQSNRIVANMFLNRFDAVKAAIEGVPVAVDSRVFLLRYYVAVLEGDAAGMERSLARPKAIIPHLARHAESLAAARTGQLRMARTISRDAIDLAERIGQHEPATTYGSATAVWEALSGNLSQAKQLALKATGMSSSREVTYAGGFALALSGEIGRSESLANDLERLFPRDTLVRFTYVPTLRALAAIARNDPARGIEVLQANLPYELGAPATAFNFFFGSLYPVYVRAQAYEASGQHQQAVAEYQKILDHPGLMMGDPMGARARLQKARSLARAGDQAGARASTRAAYEEFLELWKDADPDVPILVQAKAEYAKLR